MATDREARTVILVVEGVRAGYGALADSLGADGLELATSVAEARDRLDASNPEAVLLTVRLDEEAASLVEDVRTGRFGRPGLPIVAVTDGDEELAEALGVDETVATPVTGTAIETAVERAALLGRYKAAVNEFFDACRKQAEGTPAGEPPRLARRTADECLEELRARDDEIPFGSLIEGV